MKVDKIKISVGSFSYNDRMAKKEAQKFVRLESAYPVARSAIFILQQVHECTGYCNFLMMLQVKVDNRNIPFN